MTITRIDLHGQALPPGAVYCGRPMRSRRLRDGTVLPALAGSVLANPHRGPDAVAHYRDWLVVCQRLNAVQPWRAQAVLTELQRLRTLAHQGDLVLACWCPADQACHCDVIREYLEDRQL